MVGLGHSLRPPIWKPNHLKSKLQKVMYSNVSGIQMVGIQIPIVYPFGPFMFNIHNIVMIDLHFSKYINSDHLFYTVTIWMLNTWNPNIWLFCLVFRPPFDNQALLDHLNTRLARYSDGYCIYLDSTKIPIPDSTVLLSHGSSFVQNHLKTGPFLIRNHFDHLSSVILSTLHSFKIPIGCPLASFKIFQPAPHLVTSFTNISLFE